MQAEFVIEDDELRKFYASLIKNFDKVNQRHRDYVSNLSAFVVQDVFDHFEKQEGSEGPWQQWSDSYKASINEDTFFRRIGGRTIPFKYDEVENRPKPPRKPGMILQDTARLKNSFLPDENFRVNAAGIIWYNNAKIKGSGFPYAFAHNEGGEKLPKRDFMWLSDKAMEKISNATLDYMLKEKENK